MTSRSRTAVTSTDPRVQAALQDYFSRGDRGEKIDAEQFLAQHPEIADELRSFIAFDEEARRLASGALPTPAQPPGTPPAVEAPRSKVEISTHSVLAQIEGTVIGAQAATGAASPSLAEKPSRAEKSVTGQTPTSSAAHRPASVERGRVSSPAPSSPKLPKSSGDLPEVFGRYQVKKKLGEGAMGAVYLAEDSLLQRKVALKTPTFDDDTDGELLRRFHREARAVAHLKHPNLCAVYDVGEIDGRHYISMEFVSGKKLQEFIKPDKPMTEKQAMAVVRKIALGMHEAHSHGVIHRDLKPDNIMVNEKGEPVVMDFGLVHKTDQQNSTKITQRGTLIGSPAYMSKEQVEGDPDKLTGATDQYSLGVILYQLLTSKLPFEGGIHAVLGAILTKEPPPPSQHRPDLNPHLEAVCLKMMAKEASDRYPSMKAAADALAGVARGTATTAGASVLVRPTGDSPRDFALETTLEPAASRAASDEFDFNAPMEQPPARKVLRRRAPPPRGVLIGGLAAGLVLLLTAIIWVQFGDTRVKVEILAKGYEVKFNEAEITITDGTRETKVKPGEHTLHVKSSKPGDDGVVDEFDTEQLTLKKGGKPVLVVTRENSEVVAKLDGKPIPRRSLTVSSTGQSKEGMTKMPSSNNSKSDYDSIATGKWVRLVDASTPLPDPKGKKFSDGVLELEATSLLFQNVTASDVIIRAKVRHLSGLPLSLGVRNNPASRNYSRYTGWFKDGNEFGLGKAGKSPYVDMQSGRVGPARNDFFELAVSAVENKVTLYADGKQVYSVVDSENLDRGPVHVAVPKGKGLFKDVEVMVLDAAATPAAEKGPDSLSPSANPPTGIEFTNSLGMRLRRIEKGEFLMGAAPGEAAAFPDERLPGGETQHRVQLTKPFYLGTTEVTEKQWRALMNSSPWLNQEHSVDGDDIPAAYVRWSEAQEFCKRLSQSEGRTYRLPTEAEWEYSCRAGTTTAFSFGNATGSLPTYAWERGNSADRPHPVATKLPNPWGLYDMHGNLCEWCADGHSDYADTDAVDPLVPSNNGRQIIRGGNFWALFRLDYRSAHRKHWPGGLPSDEVGFRVVLEIDSLVNVKEASVPSPKAVPGTGKGSVASPPLAPKPGTWIKLLDTKMEPTDPTRVKLTGGVLEVDNTNVNFPDVRGKDMILRAKVKKITPGPKHLTLNVRHSTAGSYIGGHWYHPGGQGIVVAKWKKSWMDLNGCFANVSSEFTDMELEVRGQKIQFSVAGKVMASATDSDFTEGSVSVGTYLSKVQFKDLEVMILDPEVPKVPALSTGPIGVVPTPQPIPPTSEPTPPAKATSNAAAENVDLSLWTPFRTSGAANSKHEADNAGWTIQNGEVLCDTKDSGWLRSDGEFGDFRLDLEFKLAAKANGGVLLRHKGDGPLDKGGIEINLFDETSATRPEQRSGAIAKVVGPPKSALKKLGEWNVLRIECRDDRVIVTLNDQTAVDMKMTDHAELKSLPRKGYLGLSNLGGLARGIAFRNVKVTPLYIGLGSVPLEHSSSVDQVRFSPDGKWMASGGNDGQVTLWNVISGAKQMTLPAGGNVRNIVYSPDSQWLAATSESGTIRVWKSDGTPQPALTENRDLQGPVAFHPDGLRFLAKKAKTELVSVPLDARKPPVVLFDLPKSMKAIAVSADGRLCATGHGLGILQLWDLQTKTVAKNWEFTWGKDWVTKDVFAVAFDPYRDRFWANYAAGTRLFDTKSFKQEWDTRCNLFGAYHLAISPDSQFVATTGGNAENSNVTIRYADSGEFVTGLNRTGLKGGNGISWHPHYKILASAGPGKFVQLWDYEKRKEWAPSETPPPKWNLPTVASTTATATPPSSVASSAPPAKPTAEKLAQWAKARYQIPVTRSLSGHTKLPLKLVFSRDGSRLLSTSEDGTLRFWDTTSGESLVTLKEHKGAVTCCALSADGKQALSGGLDDTVRWWDLEAGTQLAEFKGHGAAIYAVAFDAGSNEAVSVSANNTICRWSLSEKKEASRFTASQIRGYPGRPDLLNLLGASFTPDARQVLVPGYFGTIHLIDTTTRSEAGKFGAWGFRDMTLSADGSLMACTSEHSLSVWDVATRTQKVELQGKNGGQRGVAFTRDGKRLIVGANNQPTRVWDIESKAVIGELSNKSNGWSALATSPDGKSAASGGNNGTILLWPLSWITE